MSSDFQIKNMMKLWLFAALLVLPSLALAEELVIPGAGPPETVTRMLAEAFNARQSAHRVQPQAPGSPRSRWNRLRMCERLG